MPFACLRRTIPTFLFVCYLFFLTFSVAAVGLFLSPYYMVVKGMKLDLYMRQLIWWYGKLYVLSTSPFIPSTLSWENDRAYDLPKSSIIVMNHFSILDLYYLGLLPNDGNVVFVTEKRPFLVKLYAPFMAAAQYIDMRTTDLEHCAELCAEHLKRGNRILFFPEAGRSTNGQVNSFKTVPFYIAMTHQVPLIPFCIAGTEKILPAGAKQIVSAPVHLRILEPVMPHLVQCTGLPHRKLKKIVYEKMSLAVKQLMVDIEGERK